MEKVSEQELNRLFSGKAPSQGSGLPDLSRFVQGLHSSYPGAIAPEVEQAHLAALIQLVNLTDKGDLAARPASKVTGPHAQASGLPKARRMFMLESLFVTLAAKIGLGAVAVAMAATGAAATGNLPDQAQTGISRAVEKVGIHVPLGESALEALEEAELKAEEALEKAEEALEQAELKAELDLEATKEADEVLGEASEPNENAAFGQSVAEDARDGGVDGQEVSEAAREMAEERRVAGQSNAPEDANRPEDAGSQGQVGLDRANQTPSAGRIPGGAPGGRS